jgi:uncharacterized protein (TIGR01319 family)
MASIVLLIDFGSTFTKLIVVDLDRAQIVGRSQAPSTVRSDVREGLLHALITLHERHALFDSAPKDVSILEGTTVLASSSAAGGLRIGIVGNVPGLTVEAGNQAALGAGAKIVGSTAFKISKEDIRKLELLMPDMILLSGGVDGGDTATILHNAQVLAESAFSVPIVVAGNRDAAAAVRQILQQGGKEARLVENVMPHSGTLAVKAAREEIRKLFMERITQAKGLDRLQGIVPVVLPTPMAVLKGVIRGAEGSAEEEGWGEMMVVDVGGATTDVHSVGYGHPAGENVIAQGLPEPYVKRTVEGDLGIRFNAETIFARAGWDRFDAQWRSISPRLQVRREEIVRYIKDISEETDRIPRERWHSVTDASLARIAVDLAVKRHVGKRERIVTPAGEAWLHYGKDLRNTSRLIATGGVFVHSPFASMIVSGSGKEQPDVTVLRPKHPAIYLDSSYLLYAVGLLAQDYPDVAVRLFKKYMRPIAEE